MKYQIGDRQIVHPDGYDWDNYAFGFRDFEFIANCIIRDKIQNILEIGAGLSSLLLSQLCHVDSLENDTHWCKRIHGTRRKGVHDLSLFWWDGKWFPDWLPGHYDAVFIDGPEEIDREKYKKLPFCGIPRKVSYEHAPGLTDVIWAHDAGRMAEMSYQLSYLAMDFRVTDIILSDDKPGTPRYLIAWKRIGT